MKYIQTAIKVLAGVTIGLIISFFLRGGCEPNKGNIKIKDTTTYKFDTNKYRFPVLYKPKPDSVIMPVNIQSKIDTSTNTKELKQKSTEAIDDHGALPLVMEYIKYRQYNEVFEDSLIKIEADIGVHQNRLDKLDLSYKSKRPTEINKTVLTKDYNYSYQVWGGFQVDRNNIEIQAILDDGNFSYGIGYKVWTVYDYKPISRITLNIKTKLFQKK